MIRADWATPPDGDFARYVDQLMARAAQARLQASTTPVDGFEGASHGSGMAPADAIARGLRRWVSPPAADAKAGAKGWSGWLQERMRSAIAIATPAAGESPRLYDPRVDRQPRKQ